MEITEEQKQKFKELTKSARKRGAWLGLQFAVLFLISNFLITVVAVIFVGEGGAKPFSALAGMVNGFFLFQYFASEIKKEHDRIKEETKKILESQ